MYAKYWYEHVKGKGRLENVGVDRRIILKWFLKMYELLRPWNSSELL